MSWLGLEENAEDPCKFTLTSRSSSGNVERYTLHSTSPGVCQVWIHQVSQILENQRNFLNGERHILNFGQQKEKQVRDYLPQTLNEMDRIK